MRALCALRPLATRARCSARAHRASSRGLVLGSASPGACASAGGVSSRPSPLGGPARATTPTRFAMPPGYHSDVGSSARPRGAPRGVRGGSSHGASSRGASTHVTHVSSLSDPPPEDLREWASMDDDADAATPRYGDDASASEFSSLPLEPSAVASDIARHRIFCNRSLDMETIAAVGFDMDYTLAMYRPETFEVLAYESTCQKLVDVYGYPREILRFEYDHAYMVRGLVVDKQRGNILKMDRHKYVKVALHGFEPLDTEERLKTYCDVNKPDAFDGNAYANVDTLFSLGETYLFCQLVELRDRADAPNEFLREKPYGQMYDEIRASVDLCHRDGTLKRAVAEDPGRFIHPDNSLVPMLKQLKSSGKKVFLLTNSLWDFTNVVMNYLVAGAVGEEKTTAWTGLFDAVVTGSCKPGFFENERAAIFEVDPVTSALRNTDDGAPMTPIGASEGADEALKRSFAADRSKAPTPREEDEEDEEDASSKIYQGGSFKHLHAMLGVDTGNQVLYVGDHIFGDILRSKKTLGWRTMLVVPELAHEMACGKRAEEMGKYRVLRELRRTRDDARDRAQLLGWRIDNDPTGGGGGGGGARAAAGDGGDAESAAQVLRDAESKRDEWLAKSDAAKEKHRREMRDLHAGFHPVWGAMMKTGSQNSRFAHQLERYACLYTSHARNLLAYSPSKNYRGMSDTMPHDVEEEFH